jgi:hypothetical protein
MIGGRPGEDAKTAETMDKADLREAYDHGRRDARASRRRHPIGMTITFVLALVGVVILGLAIVNGSIAADQAAPAASQAASNAGQSLRDATRAARSRASDANG